MLSRMFGRRRQLVGANKQFDDGTRVSIARDHASNRVYGCQVKSNVILARSRQRAEYLMEQNLAL